LNELAKVPSSGKWQERLGRSTPTVVAAFRAFRRRLKAVRTLLAAVDSAGAAGVEETHQLRVATRRTAAALETFKEFFPAKATRKLRELLKEIRRTAAEARRADVQRLALEENSPWSNRLGPHRTTVLAHLDETRRNAEETLLKIARASRRKKLDGVAKKILRAVRNPKPLDADDPRREDYTLGALVDRTLPALIETTTKWQPIDLESLEAVHRLRLTVKQLRYRLELLAGALPVQAWADVRPSIEALQERLGNLNDAHERWLLLSTLSEESGIPVELVHESLADRDREHQQFLAWWSGEEGEGLTQQLQALSRRMTPEAPPSKPERSTRRHRVAALDLGTNSVRLVVAEPDPNSGFRVLADVKETTRLGGGMFETGNLHPEAMERTISAIGRLRRIAENHQVETIRAIGTAAIREAKNQREFLKLAERDAGVEIKVVDSDTEARLAFGSVAASIDLGRRRVAVVDIGGGSTEVIFSAGGLIDAVVPLKLGAVRLTEQVASIGDLDEQYLAMKNAADELILKALPSRPFAVDAIIGCGGTFNNLARLAVKNGAAAVGGGRFQFAVSGCELPHAEVVRILDWLRRLTVAERRTVAGLSAERAEIIVAGICIIERLMERLGVERIQVHGGGVRDGLLIETIDELGIAPVPPVRRPQDAVAAAQSLLESLPVDRKHAEHVARLSLHFFDQLSQQTPDASGSWASADARLLLEIGALLHDCGSAIAYPRHHRHGYDLIHQSELPTLTRREREIVALLALYHRRRGPRDDDAALKPLSVGDQRLVAHLVGILRIADGLDRLHTQEIADLHVERKPGEVVVEVMAPSEPAKALFYAAKKCDVFKRAFRADVEIVWRSPEPAPTELVGAGAEA
jgi:exopolyphosphatase / guanosine-5'-triphosphate,3'-diphosphate pyrophosphatase